MWSLVTFVHAGESSLKAGILRRDGTVVVPEALAGFAGLMPAMASWDRLAKELGAIDVDALEPVRGAQVTAPLRFPNKLICAGANYRDHVMEMTGNDDIPEGWRPYFFLLPASTTLIGSDAAVEIDPDPSARVDWEAELAVVIGRRAKRISRAEAPGVVAGYAALNDISSRGVHKRAVMLGPPFQWDWLASKAQDGFCPMGPVVPSWFVDDPHDLAVRCIVNGEIRQNGTTANLISDLWELISAASENFTLEPGDVIATGTPAGCAAASGAFLRPGDRVRIEIGNLSAVENVMVSREAIQSVA